MFEPPPGSQPWPEWLSQPDLDGDLGPLELADGLYYRLWPEARLRLLARVSRGRVLHWVSASESQDSGCVCSEDYPRSAQRYYSNGTIEDFNPWDDDSPAYAADRPFSAWLKVQIYRLGQPPAQPEPVQVVVAKTVDRSTLPVPGSDRPFSCAEVPHDLDQLVEKIRNVTWSSARQCYERLVNWAQWDLGLARDFTNLAPHACASVFSPPGQAALFEVPAWSEPGPGQSGELEQNPLYLRLRQMAQSKAPWVVSLAQFLPGFSAGDRGSRLAKCLIWTVPPEATDPFWMAMHCVSLRLRQEASGQGVLGASLKDLDGERFFQLGGLVGALLQAPACTGCWFFDPTRPPWHKQTPPLDDLVGLLNDWSEFKGPPDPYQNHWQKAPLLASLGQWVNLRCGGSSPDPVLWQLGRFVQKDRDNLRGRLSAFSQGRLHWDSWCHDWPGVYNSEPSSMDSYWKGLGLRVNRRAEEFVANPASQELLHQPEPTSFAYRVQLVAHRLTDSLAYTNPQMESRAVELEEHLRLNPTLSPEECLAMQGAILGRPVRPGKVLAQSLQACRWAFHPWLKPGLQPELTIFPALRLFFEILAEL
ncbi:MAG: hypothetical protein U0931_05410 [Vulcanimicrobiota bacterium]